jgi:hypothetical protein
MGALHRPQSFIALNTNASILLSNSYTMLACVT